VCTRRNNSDRVTSVAMCSLMPYDGQTRLNGARKQRGTNNRLEPTIDRGYENQRSGSSTLNTALNTDQNTRASPRYIGFGWRMVSNRKLSNIFCVSLGFLILQRYSLTVQNTFYLFCVFVNVVVKIKLVEK
jgi:hypothetical protein